MTRGNLTYEDVLDMTSWKAHVCPVSEVPNAARTITSVLTAENNPTVRFLSGNSHSNETHVPPGKAEQVSVYLYRTLTNGLVLTVDDGDERAVGVAVWQGPVAQPTSWWEKVRDFVAWRAVDVYQTCNWLLYGNSSLKQTVCLQSFKLLTVETCST